jgi:serine protease AprX
MNFFGFKNKMDKTLNLYLKLNSKKKIPVIICCTNPNLVKSKILSNNGKIKYEYNLIDAFACELSPAAIDKISFMPEVTYTCFDYTASLCMRKTNDTIGTGYARLLNLTGKGVGIGIIDTGVYLHPDLVSNRRCIKHFSDLINDYNSPYDDNGHGTFISGCISSSGILSDGLFSGIAPCSNLFVIKAFNEVGNGTMSDIIMGIEVIIKLKELESIQLLCLPFEIPGNNHLKTNPLELIIKKACEAGMTVIAAAGNHGPMPYSICSPGNLSEVITVGGVDTTKGSLKNYSIASFSGRGPTIKGDTKPDIVVPCVAITSLMSDILYKPDNKRTSPLKIPYTIKSGTSIAAALICGFAALLLEKNPALTTSDLKSLLSLSSFSLGESKFSQGSGLFLFSKTMNKNQDDV